VTIKLDPQNDNKFQVEDKDAHDGNNSEQSNDLHQQITFGTRSSGL